MSLSAEILTNTLTLVCLTTGKMGTVYNSSSHNPVLIPSTVTIVKGPSTVSTIHVHASCGMAHFLESSKGPAIYGAYFFIVCLLYHGGTVKARLYSI